MKASVIVVIHAGKHHLDDSLGSMHRYADNKDVEVVLVDNGSLDSCGDVAKHRFPWVKTVRSERNLGFAGGVHLGVDASTGDVLVFLNDDAAAEDGFVESHLATLEAHSAAAVSAGRLLSWDGRKHDFLRGAVTFDVHAFQIHQGSPVADFAIPTEGEPFPFACGGNMAIWRKDWVRAGGFNRELFAYFEDVDLGWRLWAMGRDVVASPGAVARHRGSATSSKLGDFRRGVLFERNALRTFFACADDECRTAFGASVFATFLHRLTTFAKERRELEESIADPFGENWTLPSRTERWKRRLREGGVIGGLRHLLARILLGRRAGSAVLDDGFLLMQLRASQGFFSGIDATEKRRVELEAVRKVSDREILAQFPRLVVPTYAGDEEWFASDAFQAFLPGDWPLEQRLLEDVIQTNSSH